jgi:uncharacterized protein
MGQTWEDLLFAHWRLPAGGLRRLVPRQLSIDTFDGEAWIGVTPFVVRSLRLRWTPPAPFLSSFGEINVRTYVTAPDGRPGIYFLSLDAHSRLAVAAARRAYRLPYFEADITAERTAEGAVQYRSARRSEPSVGFEAEYRPRGDAYHPRPGALDHFLSERYCLYTLDQEQNLLRAQIHHPPWPLREAEATLRTNTMTGPLGLELSGAPLVHFADRQDVLIWPLSSVHPNPPPSNVREGPV